MVQVLHYTVVTSSNSPQTFQSFMREPETIVPRSPKMADSIRTVVLVIRREMVAVVDRLRQETSSYPVGTILCQQNGISVQSDFVVSGLVIEILNT